MSNDDLSFEEMLEAEDKAFQIWYKNMEKRMAKLEAMFVKDDDLGSH